VTLYDTIGFGKGDYLTIQVKKVIKHLLLMHGSLYI